MHKKGLFKTHSQKEEKSVLRRYRKLARGLFLTDVLLVASFVIMLLALQCKLTGWGKWFTPPYCGAASKVSGFSLGYPLGSISVSSSPIELSEDVGVYVVETKENNTVKVVPVNTLSKEVLKNVTLVKDGNTLKLQSDNKTISEVVLSEVGEPQELELSGNVLSITDGNSVTFLNWDTNVSDDVQKIVDLSDVSISSPNIGDTLVYNGNAWTNKQLKFVDLSDTPSDYGTAGFVLQTDGAGSINYVDPATLNVGYWKRVGTSLSPKNVGDDIVLNPGEELFLKGLTTNGGVLFTNSNGQVGQSPKLYWDTSDDRLNIDGGLNARKVATVDSSNYRSYDYNYIRRDFIVDNNFSNLYLNGLSVRAYGNAASGTSSTGMIIGLESLVGATDTLSPHKGYIDWLVALAGVVKNFGPSHTGTYDKAMALAGILDASPGSSGTINRGYGLFLNYEIGSGPGATYNNVFGVYVQSPLMVNYFAGNTGIGTDTPATKLHVVGDIYAEGGQIRLGNFSSTPSALGAGSIYYDTTSNMPFYYDGSAWQPLVAASSSDHDWYKAFSTDVPDDIANDIYTYGQVGIGTDTPAQLLHVLGADAKVRIEGSTAASVQLYETDGTATWSEWQQYLDALRLNIHDGSTLTTDVITVSTNGDVGIGTASPSARLHIANDGMLIAEGNISSGRVLSYTGGNALIWYPRKAAFRVGSVSGAQWDDPSVGIYSVVLGGTDNEASSNNSGILAGTNNTVGPTGAHSVIVGGAYNFIDTSTAAIVGGSGNTIQSNNNVIVGGSNNLIETASNQSVALGGSDNVLTDAFNTIVGGEFNTISSSTDSFVQGSGITLENTNYSFVFGENILVASYSGPLNHVYAFGQDLDIEDSANLFVFDFSDASSVITESNAFLIGPTDVNPIRVGIGVMSPFYRLELPNNPDPSGQGRANAWVTYSDARIKSNQQEIEYGLDTIMQLEPKKYIHHSTEFKDGQLIIKDEGKETIGFIAQEVYQVIPEIVYKPKDESKDLWSMDYEKLIPVLVKAIQELNSKVETLSQGSSFSQTTNNYWVLDNTGGKDILTTSYDVRLTQLISQNVEVTELTSSTLTTNTFKIVGDKLSIDSNGNLITNGNLTVKGDVAVSGTLKVKNLEIENGFIAQAQGQVTVEAGKQEVFVSVNGLPQNYNVFITQYGQTVVSYSVVRKTDGFTLKFSKPLVEDTEFGWVIFKVK